MITEYITEKFLGMNYMISFPENDYDKIKAGEEHDYPLVIYLHGAGERGDKIDHLLVHGVAENVTKYKKEYEAIVLCPQCPAMFVWNNMVAPLKELIDFTVKKYNVKKDRIAITGSSMGGCGTFEMGMTYPDFFSAMAPVAGAGLAWRACRLVKTPCYIYHGYDDPVVEYINSEMMFKAIKKAGGHPQMFTLEGKGHNDGIDYAYQNTDIMVKLINARREDFTHVPDVCEDMF